MVSTHLKNISQNGNLPQIGVKIKSIWNHHLEKTSKFHTQNLYKSRIRQILHKHPFKNLYKTLRKPYKNHVWCINNTTTSSWSPTLCTSAMTLTAGDLNKWTYRWKGQNPPKLWGQRWFQTWIFSFTSPEMKKWHHIWKEIHFPKPLS